MAVAERGTHHRRIEVTFPAEAVGGVDQRHRCTEAGQAIGVDGGLDVALHDADANRGAEKQQHLAQQGGLAGAWRRHHVDDMHMGVGEVAAVGFGSAVVLAEDLLQHVDAQPTGGVTGVITDTALVMAMVVIVLVVVVRMTGAVGVVVETSHGGTPFRIVEARGQAGRRGRVT